MHRTMVLGVSALALVAWPLAVEARGMVVAAHPLASDAGLAVLEAGGNAVDALVAVQAVLGLVEPQSSGLGGGAFLVHYDARTGRVTTFDGRETTPAAYGPDHFLDADGEPLPFWEAVIHGRSVGVPGTPMLLDLAHARFGRAEWAGLFDRAIALAEDGFEVSPRLASAVAAARGLDAFPPTAAYFLPEGQPLAAGMTLRNLAYAETLRSFAAERSQPFYEGAIARAIVGVVNQAGGIMTLGDLAAYELVERPPVCVDYRGHAVCGMGPPSSGGLTVGQILGLLGHFDLTSLGYGVDALHLIAEASRLAYADRAFYMADSDFVSVPTEGLLDPAYLTARAQLIDRDRTHLDAKAGNPPWREARLQAPQVQPERSGTSHIVIVDADGNAVSMTTTIESGFGSRLMAAGFLLNNELTDFSFRPEVEGRPVANRVEPGKRPRSSMSPTIVLRDGEPYLLVGSPGGARIIGYTALATIAVLDWGMEPQAAAELGHVGNLGRYTDLEDGSTAALFRAALEERGHEVRTLPMESGLALIRLGADGPIGGADPRREGVVRSR
ncbi:MAG: gamma-glutamyltransferase [Geminicoccaceae bacterium]|nr:MAG: gamma-glutamyltransferase [Geminicoccaceae bacterium]